MKKLMLAATILAMAGMNVQNAKAGDCEWATAGKILTGVVAGAVIASAVNSHASYSVSYSYGVPAYCPPPPQVVYVPAPVCPPPVVYSPPVVVYRAPVCAPRPVTHVPYGHYRGHGHGRGHHGRW